jgi:hypothetical protein
MVLADFVYAQVIKTQRRFRLVNVEARFVWGLPSEYFSRLKSAGLSGRINTSFVERANLTIRQSVSKLTRRTWSTAQFSTELSEHVFWWLAYYHFTRNHQSLRTKVSQPIHRKGRQQPIRPVSQNDPGSRCGADQASLVSTRVDQLSIVVRFNGCFWWGESL